MERKLLKFSVLMPVYHGDKPGLFNDALSSVLNNTVKPDQVVIVIDGPISEDLEAVLKQYESDYFDVVRIEQNQGIVNALNTGLKECRNELIARCDADDINSDNRFELQVQAFLDEPELTLCGGHILEVGESKQFLRKVPTSRNQIEKIIKFRNPMNHMTVMFKKSAVHNVGNYPDIKFREDYALWCLLYANGYAISNIDEVLVNATAGLAMYERRGKMKDIPYEWTLQKLLFSKKIITFPQMMFNLFIRMANMLVTPKLRSVIYKMFLRNKIESN